MVERENKQKLAPCKTVLSNLQKKKREPSTYVNAPRMSDPMTPTISKRATAAMAVLWLLSTMFSMVFERLEACAALASPEAKARMLVLTYVSALKMANTAYGINGAMFIQKHGCSVAKYHHGQPSKTTCEQILTEHGGRSPPIDGHQEVKCVLFRQHCLEKLCVELDFLFRSKDDQSAHCQQLESSFLPCNSSSCPLENRKRKNTPRLPS